MTAFWISSPVEWLGRRSGTTSTRTTGAGPATPNHWLKVKLEGRASNRAAIEAKDRVKATIAGTSRTQLREIAGNSGYLSREMPRLIAHFGLGDATHVERLSIEWPSGIVQIFTNVVADQMLKVAEHQDYHGSPP